MARVFEGNKIPIVNPYGGQDELSQLGRGNPMYQIFDAPALADLEQKIRMIGMGMPIEAIFPKGSMAETSFQKYFGNLPASKTVSTPETMLGYDPTGEPVMQPGVTYEAPPFFPGGVRNWAEQQVARGLQIPPELAAATNMLRNPAAAQVMAPGATAALTSAKGDLNAEKSLPRIIANLRKDYPNAKGEEVLVAAARYLIKQQSRGRLMADAEPVPDELLGPSRQAVEQIHERAMAADKIAATSGDIEKKIEAQKAMRDSINSLERDKSGMIDQRKRDEMAMKYSMQKIEIFLEAMKAFEGLFEDGEEAFEMSKQVASGVPIEDLSTSPEARRLMKDVWSRRVQLHNSKITNLAKERTSDPSEQKLLEMQLKIFDRRLNLAKLANAKDPAAQEELQREGMTNRYAISILRAGDREGAKKLLAPFAAKAGVDINQPGMFDRMIGLITGQPTAEPAQPPPGRVVAPRGLHVPEAEKILEKADEIFQGIKEKRRQPTATPMVTPAAPSLRVAPPIVPPATTPKSADELLKALGRR